MTALNLESSLEIPVSNLGRRSMAICLFIATSCISFASSGPIVKIRTGAVEGRTDGKVKAFLGIPYAAPPVGDLRWKPPQPAAKWSGVRQATEFGHHCMQGTVYRPPD